MKTFGNKRYVTLQLALVMGEVGFPVHDEGNICDSVLVDIEGTYYPNFRTFQTSNAFNEGNSFYRLPSIAEAVKWLDENGVHCIAIPIRMTNWISSTIIIDGPAVMNITSDGQICKSFTDTDGNPKRTGDMQSEKHASREDALLESIRKGCLYLRNKQENKLI